MRPLFRKHLRKRCLTTASVPVWVPTIPSCKNDRHDKRLEKACAQPQIDLMLLEDFLGEGVEDTSGLLDPCSDPGD